MRRIIISTLITVMVGAFTLHAQRRGGGAAVTAVDAKPLLEAAAQALGADTVTSVRFSATGSNNAFGQAWGPNQPWPAFKLTSYTGTIDYRTPAMRVELERTNPDGPARGGGGLPLAAPQKQITAVSGQYAWNVAATPAPGTPADTAAPATVRDRLLQIWMTPHGVIKAAQADPNVKADSNRVITFTTNGVEMQATLGVDNTIWKVAMRADTPMLGDTITEVTYPAYKSYNGVKFPSHIHQRQGGFQILDLRISEVAINPAVTLPVPPNVQQASAQPAAPVPVKVDVQKLADGVYYLTGGSHHSVAVEFTDHVVLIEAPQNEARVVAVLDAVKKTLPNKPIRYVVNTHNHFDHAGGLRAAVADSTTLVTQAQNRPYYQHILTQPHTLNPDALERMPQKPKIETVDQRRTFSDATRQLELIRLSTGHNDVMLVAYLPKEKMLIEADLFTPPAMPLTAPPAQVNPVVAEFYAKLQELKLDVGQIVPLHGRLAPIRELQLAAGSRAATN